MYRALVRSKLDNGYIVYGSARRSVLRQLDTIHHQGLRIAFGAFRTSPAQSLYVEAHEQPLTSRRLNLALNCGLKLKSLPKTPSYSCVFKPENTKPFEETSKIPPLGVCILLYLEKCRISLNQIDNVSCFYVAPWTLSAPTVRLNLTNKNFFFKI